ncbi:MAG: M15 family metallopeptidase, partial [Bacteroidetes bacterium]|nr:M15 family metallopeptidase [Bacteroidota bacterium]
IIFLTVVSPSLFAQKGTGLQVIHSLKQYKQQVVDDSVKKMVELRSVIPGIIYDLRYATDINFTHKKLYKSGTTTFLRLPVAVALNEVENELYKKGLGLKIFDAYRPYTVTVKMWNLIKDERYVADPSKGSGHNRGTAVDLTIIDLKTGNELNMGTGFDNFTDSAHQSFTNLPEDILQNRKLLNSVMEANGFIPLSTEWWHFYWNKAGDFELLDIPFKKLR